MFYSICGRRLYLFKLFLPNTNHNSNNKDSVADHLRERLLFGLVLTVPSVVFLSYRDAKNIAIIYIALMNSRSCSIGAILYMAGDVNVH